MDIFEIGALDPDAYVKLRKGEGEGTRGGHVIGHTSGGKPIYAATHERYTARKRRAKWNVNTTAQHADAHEGGGRHTRANFPEYNKQDHLDSSKHHAGLAAAAENHAVAAIGAANKKYGDHGALVAGGMREHWPRAEKDKIWEHHNAQNAHREIAHGHYNASGKRTPFHRTEYGGNPPGETALGRLQAGGSATNKSERLDGAAYRLGGERNLVAVNSDVGSELLSKCALVAQNHPRFGDADVNPIDGVDLQKAVLQKAGGEGSRGGKVIGHATSGKPIYHHKEGWGGSGASLGSLAEYQHTIRRRGDIRRARKKAEAQKRWNEMMHGGDRT